ncbi:MAG: hypothetical protein JWQ43_2591, partial [Glaciihabitans sp.]|nr:hypothetical protein [Glaciihabitans sp.]
SPLMADAPVPQTPVMHRVSGGGIVMNIDVADGARIVSLLASGREWLAPSGPRVPGEYLQPGSGGWDDASPTISSCVLTDGTVLADHGDAWQRAWRVDSASVNHVQTSVDLAGAAITLSRRVESTPTGIRLRWTASTHSASPLPVFWSAHPLFVAEEGTRVEVVPPGPPLTEEYPNRGAQRPWPTAVGDAAIKAFTTHPVGSASVVHRNGDTLTLTWDPELLPYLGLYWDGGEFTTTPVIAIEPTTALGDSAARAIATGAIRSVSAAAPVTWWMDLRVVRQGTRPAEYPCLAEVRHQQDKTVAFKIVILSS